MRDINKDDPPRRICSADSDNIVAMAALLYVDMNDDEDYVPMPAEVVVSSELTPSQRIESIISLVNCGISILNEIDNEIDGESHQLASTTSENESADEDS